MQLTHDNAVLGQPTRRELLQGTMALAASFATGTILAGEEVETTDHHDHQTPATNVVVKAALDCVQAGQACINHCIGLFKKADTTTAVCMEAAVQMLAMCNALAQMASYNSPHLPALAKVCAAVCEDCEKECRKHEKQHLACKACADSCANCAAACQKIIV